MKRLFAIILFIFCINLPNSYAFSTYGIQKTLSKLNPVNFFKNRKHKKQQKPVMPQTTQQWMDMAENINLDERYAPSFTPEQDDKYTKVKPPKKKFVKYNLPPGSIEDNLSELKKNKIARMQGIINPGFGTMAFSTYYYAPITDQISSDIFILKLDTSKFTMARVLDANILNQKLTPAISSGDKEITQYFFAGLTIVDWSPDGKKLLVKERLGSTKNGIYKTNLIVYFMPEKDREGYSKKLTKLDNEIQKYWAKKAGIALNHYRWDIKPLGWDYTDPNKIISLAYVYDKQKEPLFLGAWSIDPSTDEVRLLSLVQKEYEISVNGIIVKEYF